MAQVLLEGSPGYTEVSTTKVYLDGGVQDTSVGDASGGPTDLTGGAGEVGGGGMTDWLSPSRVRVRQRLFDGYDGEGNPMFSWQEVVDDLGLWEQVRKEIDLYSVARTAVMTVPYTGVLQVTEGAVVVDWTERAWDVQGVVQSATALELKVRRVDAT